MPFHLIDSLESRSRPDGSGRGRPRHWEDVVILQLGIWLLISPALMDYGALPNAIATAITCGVVLTAAALAAAIRFRHWIEMVTATAALWLIMAPWLMDFRDERLAAFNCLATGSVALLMAVWTMLSSDEGED